MRLVSICSSVFFLALGACTDTNPSVGVLNPISSETKMSISGVEMTERKTLFVKGVFPMSSEFQLMTEAGLQSLELVKFNESGYELAPKSSLSLRMGFLYQLFVRNASGQTTAHFTIVAPPNLSVSSVEGLQDLLAGKIGNAEVPVCTGTQVLRRDAVGFSCNVPVVEASGVVGLGALSFKNTISSDEITDGAVKDEKIESLAASKIMGVLGVSQIPMLSASKITSGVFSAAQIPSLLSLYAGKVHTHTADDVGAVAISQGASDSGKVVKLNQEGRIDESVLPVLGIPGIFNSDGSYYGTFQAGVNNSGFPNAGTVNEYHLNLVIRKDGMIYISAETTDFSYVGYLGSKPVQYPVEGAEPKDSKVCFYSNTTCSGDCAILGERPAKNTLIYRYTSSGGKEWMRATGMEGTSTAPKNTSGSWRAGSNCRIIAAITTDTSPMTLYTFTPNVAAPADISGSKYIGIR